MRKAELIPMSSTKLLYFIKPYILTVAITYNERFSETFDFVYRALRILNSLQSTPLNDQIEVPKHYQHVTMRARIYDVDIFRKPLK